MLILTRKAKESIRLGDDIEVKVLKISGSNVHLGFEAPPETQIVRTELLAQPKLHEAPEE
jgi:carbon storage regulator